MTTAPPALRGPDGHSSMADEYMQALDVLSGHPFVRQYLHQVAELYLTVAGDQKIQFWAIEFRDGGHSVMAWRTAAGEWGAGEWRPCDAETPDYISMTYFVGCPVADTLGGVLPILEAARPAVARTARFPWLSLRKKRGA